MFRHSGAAAQRLNPESKALSCTSMDSGSRSRCSLGRNDEQFIELPRFEGRGPLGFGLGWPLSGDGGAVELAAEIVVVVERLMHADAVVPTDIHLRLPAQAAGEGGLRDVGGEEFQQRLGFRVAEAFDPA